MAAGRVRMTPQRREALLDEFERGGLSGICFAVRYGLKYPTFASWVARRRREGTEADAEADWKLRTQAGVVSGDAQNGLCFVNAQKILNGF